MENKILALDLGSNSIGGSIRDLSERDNQFKSTSVITFETGVGKDDKGKFTLSHAASRTSKRSVRRLYQSRKYKLWATLEILREKGYCPIAEQSLIRWKKYNKEEALNGNGGRAYPLNDLLFNNWIKLDFNNDGIPDYASPYQLREELVITKMNFSNEEDRHKLGRALYHIAQHRGFKSSKKVQNKDDEQDESEGENYNKDKGAEGKKKRRFWDAIEKIGFEPDQQKTVGEIFSTIEKSNQKNNTNIRLRKDLHQFVTRKMLMQEVDHIFKFQEISFTKIFGKPDKPVKLNQSAIFWQRPLRSQKGTIGKCTLETNKYRCPVSHPDFEEFRAWSFLNNIQYKINGDKNSEPQQIPFEYRNEIYKDKFFRVSKKDFEFFEIAEWIKKKHANWELNYPYKTNVAACPVSANLQIIFGEGWQQFNLQTDKIKEVKKKDGIILQHKISYTIEDIWHLLFDSDDEDMVEDFVDEVLKLDEKKTNKFLGLFKSMPVAYSMLSLKAIKNILPFLRNGFIYTEATLLAKVPKILGEEIWEKEKEKLLSNLKVHVIEKNREEKRVLNIVNNLIAQYKALPQREKFAEDGNYILGERDKLIDKTSTLTDANQIFHAIIESIGAETWKERTNEEQNEIINNVTLEYQSFFSDKERKFKILPHLQTSMKRFLSDNFDFLFCSDTFKELKDGEVKCNCSACKKLNSLYHPSQIEIYPPAKEQFYKELNKKLVLLGSPKTGAFKNPMAMRALHELRKYINYLITTDQIDVQTRIVVEVARELDDNNKRWAWDVYQNRRREENKQFRDAIYELLKDPEASGSVVNPDSDSDIDKFRIWYEMIEGNDAIEGFETDKKFIALEKASTIKKNRKGKEEEIEEFNEDNYQKINKSLYFKLQKAKDNIEAKYRLWKEQECVCLYTGKIIKIADLFQENEIDFEHTIPRSKSLDNSLANLTVCYADYNRNIKRNQIPYTLPNYDKPANGYEAILPRLAKWEQKVKDIKLHVDFWKSESKKATTKERKDQCIRQRHLWQFELKYWEDKVSRFTMKEVKSGFRKSQLIDTQIISKYAFHYLKTYFNKVEVQKGINTAEFRKIFGVQRTDTPKDRSLHTHHAKDAIVLTLIPTATIREEMLIIWYELQENKALLKSNAEFDKKEIQEKIDLLQEKLKELKFRCNLPNVNAVLDQVDELILINNISKDQSLTPAKKRIRSRGKTVPALDQEKQIIFKTDQNGNKIQRRYKDENLVWKTDETGSIKLDEKGNKIPVYIVQEKWAKGDAIRGELHQQTLYAKIKKVEKDEKGKFKKDENNNFIYQFDKKANDFVYDIVIRKEVDKDFDFEKIVDPQLKVIVIKQMNGRSMGATIQEDGGIWMLKKDGSKAHKIRHIRCHTTERNPIAVRKQTFQGEHNHKNYYWAANGDNIVCVLYQKVVLDKQGNQKVERDIEIISLKKAASLLSAGLIDEDRNLEIYKNVTKNKNIDEHNIMERPFAFLKPGMKVIFYENDLAELKDLEASSISKRLYKILKFSGVQMTFEYHLEARSPTEISAVAKEKNDKSYATGYSIVDVNNPKPRLLLTKANFNFAIEGKHFDLKADGKLKWKDNI